MEAPENPSQDGSGQVRLARAMARADFWLILGLAVAAVLALGVWLYLSDLRFGWEALAAAGVLAAACAAFRGFSVEMDNDTIDVVDVALLAAVFLVGPVLALAAAVPSVLYRDRLRTTYEAAEHVLILFAAGWAFSLFADPLLLSPRLDAGLIWGALAAGGAYHALDATICSALLRAKYGTPLAESWRDLVVPVLPSAAVSVVAALGASWVTVAYSPVAGIVLFAGAGASAILLRLAREKRDEAEALAEENAALRADLAGALDSPLTFAARLVEGLGEKDGRTARLAAASAVYAADVAGELDLDRTTTARLRVAALLQDVGMSSVPDEILLTPPGKLNSVGRMRLQEHPGRGERVLSAAPGFEDAARWVRWHHEREDGTGYPDRLRGEWIPLEAKILATASVYASLVLDDPSRPGSSPLEARRELARRAGGDLDQRVVRALLRVLDEGDERYASATDGRFGFPSGIEARDPGATGDRTLRTADGTETR